MTIKAIKQALNKSFQLGQRYLSWAESEYPIHQIKADAIKAEFDKLVEDTCQAIAGAEQDKPVAWMMNNLNGDEISITESNLRHQQPAFAQNLWKDSTPLYTHPQPRKPLTDEQIREATRKTHHSDLMGVVRAIEAAHGIKE